MRSLIGTIAFALAGSLLGTAAWAQHSPRIADMREVGAEVRIGDDVTTLAGIFLTPIGPRTDARAGFGIVSVDDADSEVFLTGGLRALLARESARFPLDVSIDGEVNVFLFEETIVQIVGGPSFGRAVGTAAALIPYVQPLLSVSFNGDSETDVGVRLGADYGLTPTVDLRGDVVLADDTELRAAVYFQF
jgi:hypothetical protein